MKKINSIILIIFIIVAVTAAGLYLWSKKEAERFAKEINATVSDIEFAVKKTDEAWSLLLDEKQPAGNVMKALGEIHLAAAAALESLESKTPPALFFNLGSDLEPRLRAARDIARAAADYAFALETAAHFRAFGLHGSGLLDHAGGNEQSARAFRKELDSLFDAYSRGEFPAEFAARSGKPAADRKYVFIILIDALRADHVGAYGYTRQTTPFIDKLASEGLVFENSFAQCSATSISVASLFTALYPRAHKMITGTDWLYEKSLIDNFRSAGFYTMALSSNILVDPRYHYDYGFDEFTTLPRNRATIMMRELERRLERARGRDRVFVYLHLFEPHDIYMPPPPFYDMFDPGFRHRVIAHSLQFVLERKASCGFNPYLENWDRPEKVLDCINSAGVLPNVSIRDIDNLVARYDGEIRYADSQVEALFGYLEREKIIDDSLVVILADHGESFLEHNQFKHGQALYDDEIRVPLIFWRGREKFGGARDTRLVELIDVLPTVFGLSGVPQPAGVHGRDLFAPDFARGRQQVFSLTPTYYDIPSERYMITMSAREKRLKLIHTPDVSRTELYDIETDPRELNNLCESLPRECARLKDDLLRWNRETDTSPSRPLKNGMDPNHLQQLKDMGYVND